MRSPGCPPSPAKALGTLGEGSAQRKQVPRGENTRQPRARIRNQILWATSLSALKNGQGTVWVSLQAFPTRSASCPCRGGAGSAIRSEIVFTGS